MPRKGSLALCVIVLSMLCGMFLLVPGMRGEPGIVQAEPLLALPDVITPTLTAVSPTRAPNNLDVTLTLNGTGFHAVFSGTEVLTEPTVSLDSFTLPTVGWISSASLTATVPWGLDAGVYTVTVINPDGAAAWLTNAFTVEQAIGVWTSGGPYGGDINDLAVSPLVSTTAFAAVRSAGLFGTNDRGASWQAIVPTTGGIGGFAYTTVPTAQLYYWSEGQGLWHSGGSLDWRQIDQRYYASLAVDPQNALHLWAGSNNGASRSIDGGTTWEERSTGLPAGASVQLLAIHPTTPSGPWPSGPTGRRPSLPVGYSLVAGPGTCSVRRARVAPGRQPGCPWTGPGSKIWPSTPWHPILCLPAPERGCTAASTAAIPGSVGLASLAICPSNTYRSLRTASEPYSMS